jgi:Ran GTPase-activating protein (RanGAP) involved in mRNA processing and transport
MIKKLNNELLQSDNTYNYIINMVLLIDLPYDVLGEIIKFLDNPDILNLRMVCNETNKMVSRYGTILVKINSLDKIKKITKKKNDLKIFRKIMFKLYLPHINLNVEGLRAIGEALEVTNSLHTLYISRNTLGDEGVKAIGEALKVNHSLHTLDIWNNNLGDVGVTAICKGLIDNNSLWSLNISNNNIGVEGGRAICEALKVNNSLHRLYIHNNNLGVEGGKAIIEALKVNHSLNTLYIWDTNLGVDVHEILKSIANKKKGFKLIL